ncbi:hypothetical protein CFC21_105360 [Triticum aestivum]|uniref:non-specific serine/threonine protein kinase n=2 Tax=Triticum aestivum TaxID=4565 RepID=A0A9R1MC04_WHEAT|nr:hypothetical protein CFC21_105360 [Triticum aestivum]
MGSRRPPPTTLILVLLLCLYYAPRRAFSLFFDLNFSDPRAGSSIAVNGDALVSTSWLELTKNTRDENIQSSVGRAWYDHKVPLWSNATGEMASFTTTFSFRITPDKDSLPLTGDGMAFFLGSFPSVLPPGSAGGGLGLLPTNTNGTGEGRIVAVEFDTFYNSQYRDINGNHVGIDINSVNSTASTSTARTGKNLTSHHVMEATVKYQNDSKMLAVDLLIDDALYQVSTTVDLRRYLPEEVAVGFSAATGEVAELHQILSWSFSSTLESKKEAPPPAEPPLPVQTSSRSIHKKLVPILASVLVPLLFLLVCATAVLGWRRHKKRRANEDSEEECDDRADLEREECLDRADLERGVAAGGPRRYIYNELVAATGNFAEEKKLGRGGFGSVYGGQLTLAAAVGGVAVKVLSAESTAQGRKEFEAEVRIISRLKHRNLVQLLGWCDSRKGLLLVYELVTEGSLDRHLYNKDGKHLTWPQRYKVILGLGSALRYLHGEWEQCIVHGDIKPSNIMLDSSMSTKLGDFGLARLVDHDTGLLQTTKAVLGTAGYIDPEFVKTRRPCTESDVYSFGIVLLEIVSGRRPVTETAGKSFTLLRWVWSMYGRNTILDAADERLRGDEADEQWMVRVLIVGLWCAHPERSERPSVAQAMHVLQSDEARLPALTLHMYMTAPNPASSGPYGSFSIESSSSGCVRSSSDNTSNATLSSESSSTALLRYSSDG